MEELKNQKFTDQVYSRQKTYKKILRLLNILVKKLEKSEGDKRSAKRIKDYLHSEETGSVYIFELNSKYDIDGSPEYNKARYINHSCNPNCEVDIVDNRIWISSIKTIKKGDELSYDYGYNLIKMIIRIISVSVDIKNV